MGNISGLEDTDSGSYKSITHCRRCWQRRLVDGRGGSGFRLTCDLCCKSVKMMPKSLKSAEETKQADPPPSSSWLLPSSLSVRLVTTAIPDTDVFRKLSIWKLIASVFVANAKPRNNPIFSKRAAERVERT
ncbi:hypothetical protein CCACVL1_03962 [Corchorus capsularis]|uniref:Uncharacterized protein n=1 Tax=Corchorus capsularis TaxID=210143 RepID=A0A1R3JWG0_COCAP|nr:hypothetical protein CCACVL1_03962 [Corchorus capsularis]